LLFDPFSKSEAEVEQTIKEALQKQDFVNNLLSADGSMPAFVINIDWSDM